MEYEHIKKKRVTVVMKQLIYCLESFNDFSASVKLKVIDGVHEIRNGSCNLFHMWSAKHIFHLRPYISLGGGNGFTIAHNSLYKGLALLMLTLVRNSILFKTLE